MKWVYYKIMLHEQGLEKLKVDERAVDEIRSSRQTRVKSHEVLNCNWYVAKIFQFFTLYVVNTTKFFDFGVNEGDTQMPMTVDGSSSAIHLPTPILFYESPQRTLFVSQLCIFSFTGIIHNGQCFIYTLVVMNNNAVTNFCSS